MRKRELATLQSSLHDAMAECASKTQQLEEAKQEAAKFFYDAAQLKVKERNAVNSKRKMEYQLSTAKAKVARIEKGTACETSVPSP
jgi:RNA polymerase-binding transcription factor DksA